MDSSDPSAAVIDAIHRGDIAALRRLLAGHPELATARIDGCRTLLHVATDWPGHFPNVAATISALVESGADVNARFVGFHTETPLHWAASSNDVAAIDALLDAGADIEAPGAVIGGGTPLADARGFGQWDAARRLIERGARVTLVDAATLGKMDTLQSFFDRTPLPSADEITRAFWGACQGGQRAAAEYLLDRGADLHWVGHDGMTPLAVAQRAGATEVVAWLRARGAG